MSPDGRTLATGGWDGTVRLFDVATGQSLGAPLRGVPNHPSTRRFTPDGLPVRRKQRGAGLSLGRAAVVVGALACDVAGRVLTRAEWTEVLPGRDYAPACD